MCTLEEFAEIALLLNGVTEKPHFDRTSFKSTKNFATLHAPSRSANLKLSLQDQSTFCALGKAVYAVDNKWGLQGWTTFELDAIEKELIAEALHAAYQESKPKPKA